MVERPKARTEDLVTTEAGDDLIVYDQVAYEVHRLNAVTRDVWRLCDGVRGIEEIVDGLGSTSEVVKAALVKLSDVDLLLETYAPPIARQSRREWMRKAGIAGAAAMPTIVSITAPAAAAHVSCTQLLIEHATCSKIKDCCGTTLLGGAWVQMVCFNPSTGNDEGSCEIPL